MGQVLHYPITVLRLAGRNGEATIADHHGGDTEPVGGSGVGIPCQLRIEMRMQVDDPGCECQPFRINCCPSLADDFAVADRRNLSAVDGNLSLERWCTDTVDQHSILNHEIMHGTVPPPNVPLISNSC